MTHDTKMELMCSIQSVLEKADSRLSYGQLPNRFDIQRALKFTNTLILCEKNNHAAEQRWVKSMNDNKEGECHTQ